MILPIASAHDRHGGPEKALFADLLPSASSGVHSANLTQWFSYRRRNRERPLIGDHRPPSPLGEIQPEGWPAEYTTELLNVLARLVALEPAQANLLERICAAPTVSAEALREPGA